MDPIKKDDLPRSDSIQPGHAPLMNKVVNRLIAMGNAKPKTVSALSKALQSCTSVLPHVNPLDVLKIVNGQSEKPAPRVKTEQAAPVFTGIVKADVKFWEMAEDDRRLTGQYFKYPPPAIKKILLERAWKWLQSTPEGTEKFLQQQLYQKCKTEHSEDHNKIIKNLQQMGFVSVDKEGVVTYLLPQHSDVLLLKKVLDTREVVLRVCHRTDNLSGYVHQVTFYNESNYGWNPYSYAVTSVKKTFRVGKTTFPVWVDLADVQALFLLDGVKPGSRPKKVSHLLKFLKPACTYSHLLIPSQVIAGLGNKLHQRPVLETRLLNQNRRTKKTRCRDAFIEFAIGAEKLKKTIPLTPEGLLGLDGISPRVAGGDRECDETELETVGRSRQFASMLQSRLTPLMQSHGAVLFEVKGDQKSEILDKVSKWVNSYRLPDDDATNEENQGMVEDDEKEAPSMSEIETPPSIVGLQRELIALCNPCKVNRLPIETVVALLEQYGFITIDENQNSISYNIPNVSNTRDNAPPYWQVQSIKYSRSSFENCYSRFLNEYFPRRRRRAGHKWQSKSEPGLVGVSKSRLKQFLFGFMMIAFVLFFSYTVLLG